MKCPPSSDLFIDEEFAHDQYERLKANFLQKRPITGFKEYHDRRCWLGMDIDAGPIVCNLSPTGTAFAVGSVTYFEDWTLRKKILKNGRISWNDMAQKRQEPLSACRRGFGRRGYYAGHEDGGGMGAYTEKTA